MAGQTYTSGNHDKDVKISAKGLPEAVKAEKTSENKVKEVKEGTKSKKETK